jgi:predicted outer membrane repeat protein
MIKFNLEKSVISSILFTLTILVIGLSLQTNYAAEINITSSDDLGQIIENAQDGDIINLNSGIYTNNVTNNSIKKDLTFKGIGPTKDVILDAEGKTRMFSFNSGLNVKFINITFANAKANAYGAAILNTFQNSTLTFINCVFINNTVKNLSGISGVGTGGAIDCYGPLTVINCSFINNNAENWGGAIHYYGTKGNIINSTFKGNTAGTWGGAIYSKYDISLSGNIMVNNSASLGNAIYNNGSMSILNLIYNNNTTQIVFKDQEVILTAILTDDMGNPVTGQNIIFTVNGILIESVSSVEGYASIKYTLPNHPGLFHVSGDYEGHENYPITLLNGLLRIGTETISTINTSNNVNLGENINITGTVTDKDENPIANTIIIVNVNDNSYNVTTDSMGNWILPYTPTQSGKINVSVQWDGDDIYLGFIYNTSFNVMEINTNDTENQTTENNKTEENQTTENNSADNTLLKKNNESIISYIVNDNNSNSDISMKQTGIPAIGILLMIFSIFLASVFKKQK